MNHFADFVRAIQTGGNCLAPEQECYRSTEIVLKARQSAETGKPVAL
jgi:predicted dehydrogenase